MERFDTRVFLIAASVLVAGCGGGGGGGAAQTIPPPAAPANPAAPGNSGGNGNDVLASSAEDAARDGYEAGLDYGQALAEAKDKGEELPERPENPFLEDGDTLSDSEVDSACRKVGDEVEPTEEVDADEGADDNADDNAAENDEENDEESADENADEDADEAEAGGEDETDGDSESAGDAETREYNVEDAGQTDSEEDAADGDEEDAATNSDDEGDDSDADAEDAATNGDDEGDDADADAEDADTDGDDEGGDDVDLDPKTKRRLAAIWECAFEQGTEAGEVIYEEGAMGDAENDDGGIGLEDEGTTDEVDEDGEEADEADDETAEAANCGEGSEYAPLSKLTVERVDGGLEIRVEGSTATGGYTDAKLTTTTEELDDEGVLHLVFCITSPPEGATVTQAMEKHEAILMWSQDHERVTRVIVEGRSTSKQETVEAPEDEPEEEPEE